MKENTWKLKSRNPRQNHYLKQKKKKKKKKKKIE